MKTFYCVITTFDDKGRVSAALTSARAEIKPENTRSSNARRDVYEDWYSSRRSANNFLETAKRA